MYTVALMNHCDLIPTYLELLLFLKKCRADMNVKRALVVEGMSIKQDEIDMEGSRKLKNTVT